MNSNNNNDKVSIKSLPHNYCCCCYSPLTTTTFDNGIPLFVESITSLPQETENLHKNIINNHQREQQCGKIFHARRELYFAREKEKKKSGDRQFCKRNKSRPFYFFVSLRKVFPSLGRLGRESPERKRLDPRQERVKGEWKKFWAKK